MNASRDLCSPIPDVPLVRVRWSLGVLPYARHAATYPHSRLCSPDEALSVCPASKGESLCTSLQTVVVNPFVDNHLQ